MLFFQVLWVLTIVVVIILMNNLKEYVALRPAHASEYRVVRKSDESYLQVRG